MCTKTQKAKTLKKRKKSTNKKTKNKNNPFFLSVVSFCEKATFTFCRLFLSAKNKSNPFCTSLQLQTIFFPPTQTHTHTQTYIMSEGTVHKGGSQGTVGSLEGSFVCSANAPIDPIQVVGITSSHQALHFTLTHTPLAVAHALRRPLLSNIPVVILDMTQATFHTNTTGITQQFFAHKCSNVPVFIHPTDIRYQQHDMVLCVTNDTLQHKWVTSRDLCLVRRSLGDTGGSGCGREEDEEFAGGGEEKMSEEAYEAWVQWKQGVFPRDDFMQQRTPTEGYIVLASIPPQTTLHVQCPFGLSTALDNGAHAAVSKVTFVHTQQDVAHCTAVLQPLLQTWKEECSEEVQATPELLETHLQFKTDNWWALDAKRLCVPHSFDFIVTTESVYSNTELVQVACDLLRNEMQDVWTRARIQATASFDSMPNSYDVLFTAQTTTLNTIGYLLEQYVRSLFFSLDKLTDTVLQAMVDEVLAAETPTLVSSASSAATTAAASETVPALMYCAFVLEHPHDKHGILRVAYTSNRVTTEQIRYQIQQAGKHAAQAFVDIAKEMHTSR